MHRFTIVVYLLALVHVIGSGTDARSPWMIAMLTGLTAPIVFAFTYRMLPGAARKTPGSPPVEAAGGMRSGVGRLAPGRLRRALYARH